MLNTFRNMKSILLLTRVTVTILSFQSIPFLAQNTKSNLKEIKSVYLSDSEKLNSVNFLLKAIPYKYSLQGDAIEKFDAIFPFLEEKQKKRMISNDDEDFQKMWDDLIEENGQPADGDFSALYDSTVLTSDYLKSNIDFCYNLKQEKSWLKIISNSNFNQYVIPYRVGTERLETQWRQSLYNHYNNIKKSSKPRQEAFEKTKNTDLLTFASDLQYEIRRRVSTNRTMWAYPFDIPVSKMEQGRQGACKHLVNYTTAVMRANGIPCTADFTLLWANNRSGHKWNVLFKEDGSSLPFDAATFPLGVNFDDRKIAKVYREQFLPSVEFSIPVEDEVPNYLYDPCWKDVTKEYVSVSDIVLKVPSELSKKKYLLIGTFDNQAWQPQFYAITINGEVKFREIGRNNVYIGMYLNDGEIKTFGDPFLLDSTGNIRYLSSTSSLESVKLTRKYPCTSFTSEFMKNMVGATFSASNSLDFKGEKTLYTVEKKPAFFETAKITPDVKYRYYSYTTADKKKSYVAEIEFYDENGVKQNVLPLKIDSNVSLKKICDGDLNTYYWGKDNERIIFDFGKPVQISNIKYCPRSDSNFIVENDIYELCIWKNGVWEAVGKKKANSSIVEFENVPKNSLMLLHNLTKGQEERIFTYENENQVWY